MLIGLDDSQLYQLQIESYGGSYSVVILKPITKIRKIIIISLLMVENAEIVPLYSKMPLFTYKTNNWQRLARSYR